MSYEKDRPSEHDVPFLAAKTPEDLHQLAKATLDAVARNTTGVLGGEIITKVQAATGYDPGAVEATFTGLCEQGVIGRSTLDPRAGIVLTEAGAEMHQNKDELTWPDEQ